MRYRKGGVNMLKKMIISGAISVALLLTCIPAFAACSGSTCGTSYSSPSCCTKSCYGTKSCSNYNSLLSKIMNSLKKNCKNCKAGKAASKKCKVLKACKTGCCNYKLSKCCGK